MSDMAAWPTTRLGDVIEAKYGKTLPQAKRKDGSVPVYGSNGVVGQHDAAITSGPTIIIGRKGSSGAVNSSRIPCWPIDTTYYIDDPGPYAIEFLARLLRSLGLTELDRSTAIPGLNREQLYDIEVPVPPLREQESIVEVLSQVESLGVSAARHLAVARRAIERFRQAVLAAACSGRLTAEWRVDAKVSSANVAIERKRAADRKRLGNKYRPPMLADVTNLPAIPETWCWAALPELGELGRGRSKHRPRNDPKLYGGEYPFIQTGDVARSGGRIAAYTQTYNEVGLHQSRLWPEDTVCITIAANIADSALLTFPACFPDSVVGLVTDKNLAFPEYVELFIRTARRDLAAFAPATAQANINLAILAEVAVALPPIAEQREIIRVVEAMYQACRSVSLTIDAAASRIEQSSQAVLAKAFRGDLVPTIAMLAVSGD